MRIALLSYRGHPQVGGQGVYVAYLSRALRDLGHQVEVLAGPPYPELDSDIPLVRIPSLDLYRPDDLFRRPGLSEIRGFVDVTEYLMMCAAAFPEPLTFSLRAAHYLRRHAARFDVVHDNQCLGYGLVDVARRAPVIATVHHPITIDRRLALADATSAAQALRIRRWFAFTRMQARVARRLTRVLSVSEAAARDVVQELGVEPGRIGVVHNGVDAELFRPLAHIPKVRGRMITVASSDVPMKGFAFLIEALAKLRTEGDATLVVVGKGGESERARALVSRWGVAEAVTFEGRVDAFRLVELYASSEVAVVPSLYEGFSLPAIEAMSARVPVVGTMGGALPEVIGTSGETGLLVPASDAGALAAAIRSLFEAPGRRHEMGRAARERVLQRFTWSATARATVEEYRVAMAGC